MVGVRLSAKHSGKQMSNPYLTSMGVVKWSFNPHLGLAHGSPFVRGAHSRERARSEMRIVAGPGRCSLESRSPRCASLPPRRRGPWGRPDARVPTPPLRPSSRSPEAAALNSGCAEAGRERSGRSLPRRPGLCPATSAPTPFQWPRCGAGGGAR